MGETGKTQWGAEKGRRAVQGTSMGEETLKPSVQALSSSPRVKGIRGKAEGTLFWLPLGSFPCWLCREAVEKILGELSVSSKEVTFGKTKIFIKSPKTVSWRVRSHLAGLQAGELESLSEGEAGWRKEHL